MPRKAEPSFRLKQIIWDLAATTGAENLSAFQKDLDYTLTKLRDDESEDFCEHTPDIRTIRRIIKLDINRLTPEVVITKLPRHVWHLRRDYEEIKRLAESEKATQQMPTRAAEETANTQIIRKQAQMLRGKINLPGIRQCFSFDFDTGPKRILFQDSRRDSQRGSQYVVAIDKNGRITVELSMKSERSEETGLLWESLQSHLETGGLSEVLRDIDSWAKRLGRYFEKCRRLLRTARGELKVQGEFPDNDVERNEKPGYQKGFFTSACADAVEIAYGNRCLTDSEYWPGYRPQTNTYNLWNLMRTNGTGSIYVANSELEAKKHQLEHQALVITLSKTQQAKEVAKLRRELEQRAEKIQTQLLKFQYMQPLPGHCKLC